MAVNDLINLGAIEALEQAELLASRPVRQIPSWSDPYELSDNAFIKLYRLTKPMTENLIDILTPHIPAPTTISGLSFFFFFFLWTASRKGWKPMAL
nr:unnamed protein product [Callosobruchus analis]